MSVLRLGWKLYSRAQFHLTTVYLFTRSDFMSIFPTILFAGALSDNMKKWPFVKSSFWVFIHLFQINVSNQSHSGHEDKLNKPWRPLPSGRISIAQARWLRWILSASCLTTSFLLGRFVLGASFGITLLTILYDDLQFDSYLILRNWCNAAGYIAFEIGAIFTITPTWMKWVEAEKLRSLARNALLIFTTISAHDFPDVKGDRHAGRRTLPVIAPSASRWYISAMVILWTMGICQSWSLGPVSRDLFFVLGMVIAVRFLLFRDAPRDKYTLSWYKIWLIIAHLQPAGRKA